MGCGRDYKLHMSNIYPVILSGGSGTRLWPISRSLYPKQFLKIGSSKSFFQETALRFFNQSGYENPIIICNSEHRFIVKEQLTELDITPTAVILEEEGRNTAGAAAIVLRLLGEAGRLFAEGFVRNTLSSLPKPPASVPTPLRLPHLPPACVLRLMCPPRPL